MIKLQNNGKSVTVQLLHFKRVLINLCSKFKSNYFHFKKNGPLNFTANEQQALKNIKNGRSIIICKPDKGQRVAILDRLDYVAKMDKILSEKSTFVNVPKDDNLSNLEKFQNFLYRFKRNGNLDQQVYQEI